MRWVAFSKRNNRPGTFHVCLDWPRSGARACDGQDMTHAGWTSDKPLPAGHLKTCKRCEEKIAK